LNRDLAPSAFFGAFILCVCLSPLSARVAVASNALALQEAVESALGRNKELAAFKYRIDEQQGRREQAAVLPNLRASVELEDFGGSGDFSQVSESQTTVSIGWLLEPGVRKRRVGLEHARSGIVELDGEILLLEIAAETAQRFLSCLANQARLSAANDAVALAEKTSSAVSRRVQAARAPGAEQRRAEAELALAQLSLDDITHELKVAYRKLAAQWGEITPGFSTVDGDLSLLPEVKPFEVLVGRISETPQLLRLANEQKFAEAKLALAKADRWPKLRSNLGVRDKRSSKDVALVAGLSFDLPVFDRKQGTIRQALAMIERSRTDAAAQRVRIHTTLFELYEEMQHFIHRAEALRDAVIPRLEQALSETRRGYERGRYGYDELSGVQSDLLEARGSLIEASAGVHRLVIALERLTGKQVIEE
jgi:cobalt-zinc-cadmium efflux system outer membrane protein